MFHGWVDGGAEKHVGLVGDELAKALHEQLDFEKCQVLAAGEMDENGLGVFEKCALIQQGAVQRVFQGFAGAVLAIGDA